MSYQCFPLSMPHMEQSLPLYMYPALGRPFPNKHSLPTLPTECETHNTDVHRVYLWWEHVCEQEIFQKYSTTYIFICLCHMKDTPYMDITICPHPRLGQPYPNTHFLPTLLSPPPYKMKKIGFNRIYIMLEHVTMSLRFKSAWELQQPLSRGSGKIRTINILVEILTCWVPTKLHIAVTPKPVDFF